MPRPIDVRKSIFRDMHLISSIYQTLHTADQSRLVKRQRLVFSQASLIVVHPIHPGLSGKVQHVRLLLLHIRPPQ